MVGAAGLNLLVNNAGVLCKATLLESTAENMRDSFDTNVVGPMNVIKVRRESDVVNATEPKGIVRSGTESSPISCSPFMLMDGSGDFFHDRSGVSQTGEEFHPMLIQWKPIVAMYSNAKSRCYAGVASMSALTSMANMNAAPVWSVTTYILA